MELFLVILYSTIFLLVIRYSSFYRIKGISFYIISSIFIIKILCGYFVYLIYSKLYYQREYADIFKYFDDGAILFSAIYENPFDYLRMLTGLDSDAPHLYKYYEQMGFWIKSHNYNLYNDNRTVIRFNALVYLFSFGNFNVHTVFINFLSFTGLIAIYKSFLPFFNKQKYELLGAVFLLPTIMFWGSGVLKEGILLFGVGIFIYNVFKITEKFDIWFLIGILASMYLLMLSKFYVLFALMPGIISYICLVKFPRIKTWISFSMIHIVFLCLFFGSKYIIPKYDLAATVVAKQHDFINMINELSESPGSKINIPILESNFWGIIKNVPNAIFNTVFRPHFADIHSIIVFPALIENLIIFLLIILTIIFLRPKINIYVPPLVLCLSFVFILYSLTGLTTPVLGALVRYKMPALPFLVIGLLLIFNTDKLYSKLNLKFKKNE